VFIVICLVMAGILAFCVGNFPQLVRNLHPLLSGGDLTVLRHSSSRPVSVPPSLLQWATQTRTYPQVLLAAGVLRLARHFEAAAELLRSKETVPASWQALRANEEAFRRWRIVPRMLREVTSSRANVAASMPRFSRVSFRSATFVPPGP